MTTHREEGLTVTLFYLDKEIKYIYEVDTTNKTYIYEDENKECSCGLGRLRLVGELTPLHEIRISVI